METILGKQVLPIVDENSFSGPGCDYEYGGMGAYLKGDAQRKHYRMVVEKRIKEAKKDNENMKWFVYAVTVNGKYTLMTRDGFEQSGLDRTDFKLLDDGEVW